MDEGSSLNLLDESLSTELGLAGPKTSLALKWYGKETRNFTSNEVNMQISDTAGTRQYALNNAHTVRDMQLPIQTVDVRQLHTRFQTLKSLPVTPYTNAMPRLLIGLDNGHLGFYKKGVECTPNGPMASKTRLGWVLYGRVNTTDPERDENPLLHADHANDHLENVEKMISDYFSTDNFGISLAKPVEGAADERAKYLLKTLTKRMGCRYETGLLWASDVVHLPDSKPMALRRLFSVEKKMARDPDYAAAYRRNIDDYVSKGYARKLTADEAALTTSRTWYLPHFGVINIHKPGKLRLVFDAAASVAGVSLNSCLLKGPDLNRPMTAILHQFREGPVGVCGDVREMFHQVLIRPEDQNSHRFLWRTNGTSGPVDTYIMVAMTFGAACSPCAAQYVKNLNADDSTNGDEDAVAAIKHGHYVDDFVASFASIEDATRITTGVKAIHQRGGFELRNFVSNEIRVLKSIGSDASRCQTNVQLMDGDATDKILGMYWNTREDAFQFRLRFLRVPESVLNRCRRPTKRELLSITMSVFDPFGMLANFTVYAKLLLQELWGVGIGWDESIPDDTFTKWTQWMDELNKCASVRVPRCYSANFLTTNDLQLHVFADASAEAFAAVAYWRMRTTSGEYVIAFVAGKTRCAPRKLLSIPRLELQAAVMASRLGNSILAHHAQTVSKRFYWTDSKTVVQWIHSDHRKYKPFVAHRIAEVFELSEQNCWRWVPTDENVADDATRAIYPAVYDVNGRWLAGPNFLLRGEEEWPRTPGDWTRQETEEEIRGRFVMTTQIAPEAVIDVNKFSSYMRLLRATARVMRFINILKSAARKETSTRGELQPGELEKANAFLCRQAQMIDYYDEYEALSCGRQLERSSALFALSAYLDDNKVIRMRGRIDGAQHISTETCNPVILSRRNAFTEIIMRHHHLIMRHQQLDAVICAVRQKYWVPQIRVLARHVKTSCTFCKLRRAVPIAAMMGPLPEDRCQPYVRPFSYTGLDYFGPLNVAIGRRREKRWVALFSCLSTRAVHLELAENLSTDACLLCIRNFVNIRGVPIRIRSDNGTNFVGAAKEVQNAVQHFDHDEITRQMATRGIEWRFNCPANPEAGGAWERMVQCVKKVLYATLQGAAPRVETLRSVLIEAANIVNSRPLTHIPVDPTDELPLTPNHFVIGESNQTQKLDTEDEQLHKLRKQWRIAQQLKDRYWRRWINEYLPELTRRTKWHVEVKPLAVGELVIVCDTNVPRGQWRRGRIVEVFPGRDGRIRSAAVKTSDGILKRPRSRLAVLDISDGEAARAPASREVECRRRTRGAKPK